MLLNPKRNLAALVFFVLGVGILFGVQHLRYAEFSELGNQIKQGMTRRRRSLAVNVRVRRTSDDLSNAESLDQLFASLEEMLATNEFDRVELAAGDVLWDWERKSWMDELRDEAWTLCVPLTEGAGERFGTITFYRSLLDETPAIDIAHLCGSLQRELSGALVRLMGERVKG